MANIKEHSLTMILTKKAIYNLTVTENDNENISAITKEEKMQMASWNLILSEADEPENLKKIFITFYAMQHHYKNYTAIKKEKETKEQDLKEDAEDKQDILTKWSRL